MAFYTIDAHNTCTCTSQFILTLGFVMVTRCMPVPYIHQVYGKLVSC